MTEELGKIKNKSLEKAIRVLNCFIEKQPLGITEISEKLGLYKSNVYDILSTLTALEFAVKDEESNKYYLGIGALRLGRAAAQRYSFQEIAAPHIRQIAKEAGEICYLTIPNGYEVYYLDAAIPNVCIQEFPSFYLQGSEGSMITQPLQLDRGYLVIPEGPGIGIELAEDITEKFPPAQRSLHCQIAFDGSVHDI